MFSYLQETREAPPNDHAQAPELLADRSLHVADHTSRQILKKLRPKASTLSLPRTFAFAENCQIVLPVFFIKTATVIEYARHK